MTDESEKIPVDILRETEAAYLLRRQSDGTEAWFPKSQIVWERRNQLKQVGVADIPDWLLEKKDW